MANMEELHMAASAYYGNASNELRQLATEFFNSMDTDGDGGVSFNEFVQFLVQIGYHWVDPNLFRSLDRNGDGLLDFFEVLTCYYILKTRGVWCACCKAYLMGLYFTCVACFDNARITGHTYDLCSMCYEARRHQQQHPHHNYFLDSHVLLRAKAGLPLLAGAPNANVWCDCCKAYLMGRLYFTCVACFDNARSTGHTYDLCSTCYGARRHQQQHPHHNYFLDIYVLLRAKAGLPLPAGAPNFQQALVQHAPSPNISQRALIQHAPSPNISQQALVPRCAPNTPHQMEKDEMQRIDTKNGGEDIDLKDKLDELAELPQPKKSKSKTKTNNKNNKRRRTSSICHFFHMLPTKVGEEPVCKCKKCGKEYIAVGVYGIGNLKRHLNVC